MSQYSHIFSGPKGYKSGMLGRWMTQADQQKWRDVPWEKMSQSDRDNIKELPDWLRVPLGMEPRSIERFKEGKNVPDCVTKGLIKAIERITCGGEQSPLTCGNVDVKQLKKEGEKLLTCYWEAQKAADPECKPPKIVVSDRWINRLLQKYGWSRRTPNTCGAYLEYDDERMDRSRKSFAFTRLSQDVPLELCINFDQVWKQSWPDPKKVLLKYSNCGVTEFLCRKRNAALEEMANMRQRQGDQWEVKRCRLTGQEAQDHECLVCTVYIYIYKYIIHIPYILRQQTQY